MRFRKPKEVYPYVWTRTQKPAGYQGQRCKINRKLKGQGMDIVAIEFQNGREFAVLRSGLRKHDGN